MKNRYFLAIVLPQPYLDEVEKIKQQLFTEFGLKGGMRSPSHITLHMPFELQSKNEPELINVLKNIKLDSPFEIECDGFGAFDERVIFINVYNCKELLALHKNCVKQLAKSFNFENELNNLRGFHPHITIAYRDLKKHQFVSVRSYLSGFNPNFKFFASEFSILKLNSTYEVLNSFPISTSS